MRSNPLVGGAIGFALCASSVLTALPAAAQPESSAHAAELTELEQTIEDELAELATAPCTIACRALESMSRAAARLCELAPGPRCERARGTVEEARRKVSARCPDCAAAATRLPKHGMAEPGAADDSMVDQEAAPATAPPAERSGGCAACTVGVTRDPPDAVWPIVVLGLAALRRRRGRSGSKPPVGRGRWLGAVPSCYKPEP